MNPYLYLLNGSPNFNSTAGTSTFFNLTVTGTALFANGTAAAPSIAFASETGTGLFRQSAGVLGFAISGVLTFRMFNPSAGGRLLGGVVNNTLLLDDAGGISLLAAGTNQNITLTPSGTGFAQIGSASGTLLLVGTGTNSNNGAIQLAAHTTSAGGIGFGNMSLYRQNNDFLGLSTSGGATALAFYRSSTQYGTLYFDTAEAFVEPNVSIPFSIRISGQYALTCDTSKNTTFFGIVIHKSYTVATLPAAAAGNTYGIVFVSDATQLAGVGIGTAPTGGGAVKRGVYSTGAAWLLI